MSLKLEAGEFYLSVNGNITKIVDYIDNEDKEDEYNYLSNDDEWYRCDGRYEAELSNRDLIAHIPKELHQFICEMINDYYCKKTIRYNFDGVFDATNK